MTVSHYLVPQPHYFGFAASLCLFLLLLVHASLSLFSLLHTFSLSPNAMNRESSSSRSPLNRNYSAGSDYEVHEVPPHRPSSAQFQVSSSRKAYHLSVTIHGARCLTKWDSSNPTCSLLKIKIDVDDASNESEVPKPRVDKNGVIKIDKSFTFALKDPTKAVLAVHVYARSFLGIWVSHGCFKSSTLIDLMKNSIDDQYVEAKWYELASKSMKKNYPGKILMHIAGGSAEPEQKIRVFAGTWNVGNCRPPQDLSPWLPSSLFEIIAIGTQECDYPPSKANTDWSKDWMEALRSHLGSSYKVVCGLSRGQMLLAVFLHQDAEKALLEVRSGSEATGVGHVMANKGGLCISFKIWDTGLCFVNCHFAAHDGRCEARNSNYREIVSEMRVGFESMDILNQFHHVFWMGDLNYRLDFGAMEEKSLSSNRNFWNKIVKQIEEGNHKSLLDFDELHREQAAGKTLIGFKEGEIKFPPTYKMKKNSIDCFDEKRVPAWCDRVLWRSLPGCEVELLSYFSSPQITTSDHKPVAATFSLTCYTLPSTSLGSSDDEGKRWHIQFTALRTENLRTPELVGYCNPYIAFVGPNLFQDVESKVRLRTLNPVWDPIKELPVIVMNTFRMERLQKEFIWVRAVSYEYTAVDVTLGYGVISLAPVVTAFQKGSEEIAEFSVQLTHHGLPCGTLVGGMKLTWERNVAKRKFHISSFLMGRTLSWHKTMKKVLSTSLG